MMFTSLHALAQQATLMITIAAEGDDQLRVNVTPMPADTKAKSKLPAPLSLLATPAEFDVEFAAALSTWQAPKRSLIQQALDAAGVSTAPSAPALPAPKADAKSEGKTEKAGRKARGAGKGADDEKKVDSVPAAAAAAGEAAAAADQAMAVSAHMDGADQQLAGGGESNTSTTGAGAAPGQDSQQAGTTGDEAAPIAEAAAPAPAPAPAAGDEPVDTFTLDLF